MTMKRSLQRSATQIAQATDRAPDGGIPHSGTQRTAAQGRYARILAVRNDLPRRIQIQEDRSVGRTLEN